MQIRAIGNHVADIDADAKPDSPVRGLIIIIIGHTLLHVDRATYSAVDAVERDEQRVATGLNELPAVLIDHWVDQSVAEDPKPFERS